MRQPLFTTNQSLDDTLSQSTIGAEIRRLEKQIHRLQQATEPDTAGIAALANQLRERIMVLNWSRGHR
ncbi:hypothetical protein QWY82_18750 [Simiduia curdlanivorans]|uniref:Uncharacterized protein n=1 Tax=Simiduia curdlanivorans TaxID=1492769 RepID=A0ABV8V548_9GAMM|nr:hypothetical protein [Simiduia curdlanivorans]MDN3640846.1 hypothetical protein [Simiduia curdlanivorans]